MNDHWQKTIARIYRNKSDTYLLIAGIIGGLIADDRNLFPDPLTRFIMPIVIIYSICLATTITARFQYHRHPFCPVCGLDAVDCKVKRRSLFDHRPPAT